MIETQCPQCRLWRGHHAPDCPAAPTPPLPHAAADTAAAEAGTGQKWGNWLPVQTPGDLLKRAEAAEAERDRLSAELAAVRGAMPIALEALDRLAAAGENGAILDFGNHYDWEDSKRYSAWATVIRAALATATPTPQAAEAGTGREAMAWMLRWAPVVVAAEAQADEVGNLGPAYTRACTQTVLAVRAARVQEADHAR